MASTFQGLFPEPRENRTGVRGQHCAEGAASQATRCWHPGARGVLKAGDTEAWGLELFCRWSGMCVGVRCAGHGSQ